MGDIREFKRVEVHKLVPYENNAKRHSKKQIDKLCKSIEQFGFVSPVLIDKDYNIIAGHGRTEAAKALGMFDVPCIFIEGLTEEQRKAYILADNRLSELGSWDKDLVSAELAELDLNDFDFDITGFEMPSEDLQSYFGDERERTIKGYNLDIAAETITTNDFWQMPEIRNDNYVPDKLIGFNYAKSSKDKAAGIHFFLDDYQFERLWNSPEKYIDVLKGYECILTPDFSLYNEMPMPMKIWNVYRSRQIGAFYQSKGIKVIPTISWSEPDTFEFCFLGVPEGSIVAISTIGVKENDSNFEVWAQGVDAMIEAIHPSLILIYGGELEHDYKGVEVKYFSNQVLDDWKKR